MKNKRQLAIISIINEQPIKTHEQIVGELEKRGFSVTQATVSRDIKDLCLIKKPDGVYSVADNVMYEGQNTFIKSVISVDYAGHMIVIKTTPGTASAVAAFTDETLGKEIMGSIAGDDNIFMVVKSEETARYVTTRLRTIFDLM